MKNEYGENLYLPVSSEDRIRLSEQAVKVPKRLPYGLRNTITPLLIILSISVIILIMISILYPHKASQLDSNYIMSPPCGEHWLGTNRLGQDFLAQIVQGTLISLLVSLCSAILSAALGTFYGMISGYAGGKIDIVMCRIIEIVSCVPPILWIFVLSAVLDKGLMSIILVLGLSAWANTAIIVRGRVLELKERDFIKAAKAMGASPLYIESVHILSNCLPLVLVQTQFLIPSTIFSETMLSYVGMGVQYPSVSLGTVLKQSMDAMYSAPYQLLCCMAVLLLIVGFFYIFSEKLRKA